MEVKFKNNVVLLGTYGGDKTHSMSAWCSTFKEFGIEIPDEIDDRIDIIFDYMMHTKKKTPAELLEMLASSNHGTPFEKSFIHFQIETDIASHIHLLKHRVGVSVNAESARYKRLSEPKMYIPFDWPNEEIEKHIEYCQTAIDEYHRRIPVLVKHYQEAPYNMERSKAIKRAKETARFCLPYSNQIVCDVSFNWRSFYHFLGLRYSKHSQTEIQRIAEECLKQLYFHKYDEFKHTMKAFDLLTESGELRSPFAEYLIKAQ